jgi:TRAP-type C4-dicarboxylate transport system permease small subunit
MALVMRWIARVSNAVLSLEKRLVTYLAAALVLLILLNIVTRAGGAAIFWVDELAIYTMIWMSLIGASAMLRMRVGVAVTLIADLLPRGFRRSATRLVDAILLFFALVLLVLSWRWYDPVALIRSGFDLEQFAQTTLKFIYSDPTNTLGIGKFWVWLAVPIMAVAMTVHALANLLEGPPEASQSGAAGADPVGPA